MVAPSTFFIHQEVLCAGPIKPLWSFFVFCEPNYDLLWLNKKNVFLIIIFPAAFTMEELMKMLFKCLHFWHLPNFSKINSLFCYFLKKLKMCSKFGKLAKTFGRKKTPGLIALHRTTFLRQLVLRQQKRFKKQFCIEISAQKTDGFICFILVVITPLINRLNVQRNQNSLDDIRKKPYEPKVLTTTRPHSS